MAEKPDKKSAKKKPKSVAAEKAVETKTEKVSTVDARRKVQARTFEEDCLALKVRGYSYSMIARELNCSASGAQQAVSRVLQERYKQHAEKVDEQVQLMIEQIDEAITGLSPRAFAQFEDELDEETGQMRRKTIPCNPKYVAELNKMLTQKAQLLGLYKKGEGLSNQPLPWNDDE